LLPLPLPPTLDEHPGAEEVTSLGSALLFSKLLISSTMAECRLERWF
jgi:hypothetical protein